MTNNFPVSVGSNPITLVNGTSNDAGQVNTINGVAFNNTSALATGLNLIGGTTTTNGTIDGKFLTLRGSFTGNPASTDHGGLNLTRGNCTTVSLRWNQTSGYWDQTSDGTNYYKILTTHNTFCTPNTYSACNTFTKANTFCGTTTFVKPVVAANAVCATNLIALGQTLFNGSAGGYLKLPVWDGGALKTFIVQWGTTTTISNNSSASPTYPVAFGTACRFAAASYVGSDSGTSTITALSVDYTSSLSHLTIYKSTNGAGATDTHTIVWFAVGY